MPEESKPKLLEKKVEAHLVKRVKESGGIAYKFTSPQRRSVPDRLVLLDVAKAARMLRSVIKSYDCRSVVNASDAELEADAARIVAEMVHFVETKATGAKPTEMQEREHAKLRAMGFTVKVIDNKEIIDKEYKND